VNPWGVQLFRILRGGKRNTSADLARAILADSKSYHPLGSYVSARMKRSEEAFHQRWHIVSRVIHEYAVSNFCDLGCAEGYYVRQAAREHRIFAVGIDKDRKRLRSAVALSELDQDWSCAFMQMDITSTTIRGIPQFDMIACMSLLHHVIHRSGIIEAKTLLCEIAKKVTKCMIFDVGGPNENANKWASSLCMLAGDVDANIASLLSECGFRNITVLGHTTGYDTSALRGIFVAEPSL
jgi:2-polyprenyl-3-methyl-5-hydroxy-6-metoxy-1,4-benzoquinol methylase